jgi:hypothetical protein
MRGFAAFIAYLLGISLVGAFLIAEPGACALAPAAQIQKANPVGKGALNKASHPRQRQRTA